MDAYPAPQGAFLAQTIYIIYRRLRPTFGLTLGFILMFGTLAANFTLPLLFTLIGFSLVAVMGDLYNDYWDYEEDLRNQRSDKILTARLMGRQQVKTLSITTGLVGLVMLMWRPMLFILGAAYFVLLIAYSHPKIRLKGTVAGYSIISAVYPVLILLLGPALGLAEGPDMLLLAGFCFTQYAYILCQKDSTDLKDAGNIFLSNKWSQSFAYTAIFAVLSSAFLLMLSAASKWLLIIWVFNMSSKAVNLRLISGRRITRSLRSNLVLMEFLTPYLYAAAVL
jgi:hypothetical protein